MLRLSAALTLIACMLLGLCAAGSVLADDAAPRMHILMTNDDGIEEVESRLYPVAQELRRFATVTIVVSEVDRSGSTHFMAINRQRTLESELDYVSPAGNGLHRLEIHVVNGFPADCVLLGARGILADDPPDLVISGPNGGANLADDWFGSGTVGAARTAAFLGIPAVAVSGLDDDEPDQVQALARWVARLAQADVVQSLPRGVYLTVGVPRIPPTEIAGIRVARRARLVDAVAFETLKVIVDDEDPEDQSTVWAVHSTDPPKPAPDSDVVLHAQNYIVVTPMRADEHAEDLLQSWGMRFEDLPAWSTD